MILDAYGRPLRRAPGFLRYLTTQQSGGGWADAVSSTTIEPDEDMDQVEQCEGEDSAESGPKPK